MMKIFPDHWAHPDASFEVIETPTDRVCYDCDQQLKSTDRGVIMPFAGGPEDPPDIALHRRCFLRNLGIAENEEDV